MKVKEMDDFSLAFEEAYEWQMINTLNDEFSGTKKKDNDSLKGFISKLAYKVCKKYLFASSEEVTSVILPECITYIKAMNNRAKSKAVLKNEPDRLTELIENAVNRRISINKVCVGNYILPEFASAVLMSCFIDDMTAVIYATVNESGIAKLGASEEQLDDAIQTIASRINEGFEAFNNKLDTIIQNYSKYSN
ncbi:hypothetical protein [Ruminiclostridium cellobioparum]|uniref:hypothetical protein n=1 Tax=Ruminiclostridium cellobioparum TaxID=29355 RepID=UPI0028AD08DA|nr:hypothetical protein [Ruminiclostridium cellobioparum]